MTSTVHVAPHERGSRPARRGADTSEVATRLARVLGTVATQAGVLTAMLYYVGWVRTRSTAERLGLDVSLFGYSTQEYVLRSVDSTLLPLGVILVVLTTYLIVTDALARLVAAQPARRAPVVRMAVSSLDAVGAVFVGAGVLVVNRGLGSDRGAWLMLCGCGLLSLGLSVARHIPRSPAASWAFPSTVRSMRVLLAGVALVATFALVGSYAERVGVLRAQQFVASLASRGEVVVFSAKPLAIEYPSVTSDVVVEASDPARIPTFRYRGLKLVARAGSFYYVVPSRMVPGRVVTIAVPVDGVRLDFGWARN